MCKEENITSVPNVMDYKNITEFVACHFVSYTIQHRRRKTGKIMFIHPNGPALSHRHYKIRSLAKFPRHDTLMNVYLCTATQRTCTIMVTKNDKINETFFLSLIDKFGVRILKYIQFFLKYDNNTWLNLCTEQNSTIHSFLKLQAQ
jgi:hypothetical protein